jgi:NAD(P)-dependent dehydrogenase (short-subunit alcohol dehydrogenase family)
MDLEGKVAVVTGGSGGIGRALAEGLLLAGASVTIVDLDRHAVDSVAVELEGTAPDRTLALAGDAADNSTIAKIIATTRTHFGPVDLYFANAGVAGDAGIGDSDEQWAKALDVNVMAHVRAARQLIPGWLDRGEGYFVSTASAAGLLAQIGMATYSVTKHATVAFAEWLSITYGDRGVRVSCVCPMGVSTPLLHHGTESGLALGAAASRSVTSAGAVLTPKAVADATLRAVRAEEFLVLPHPEVKGMFAQKATDVERWLSAMRRFQARVLSDLNVTDY